MKEQLEKLERVVVPAEPDGRDAAVRKGRRGLDRVLLALVLFMQVVILAVLGVWLYQTKRPAVEREVGEAVHDVGDVEGDGVRMAPVVRQRGADPLFDGDPLFGQMDEMFKDTLTRFAQVSAAMDMNRAWDRVDPLPAMDMRSDSDGYTVLMTMPGGVASNLEVTINGQLLTVRGTVTSSSGGVRGYSSFHRCVHIPSAVNMADAAATLSNGVLRICLPRAAGVDTAAISPRRIL